MPQPHPTAELQSALDRWTHVLPKILGGIAAVLMAAAALRLAWIKYFPHPGDRLYYLAERFGLGEMNFVAWFSSCMLTLCCIISAIIATIISQQKGHDVWRWWSASVLLLAMSADETIALHEMLGDNIAHLVPFDGFFFYAWVVAAIPILVVIFITLGPILLRLPRRLAQRLLFASLVYFGGAVGIEMISAKLLEIFPDGGVERFLCLMLEESMEMTGLILGIHALMLCLQWRLKAPTEAEVTQT